MKRVTATELMDRPSADPERLAESLRDLAWVNRYLGGTAAVIHQLRTLLDGYQGRSVRVLDVAAGGGDVLLSVARWCRSRGLTVDGIALDYGGQIVRYAEDVLSHSESSGRFRSTRGDARALPFADRSMDITLCSTFLHHLEEEEAVLALREMARVSRRGLVACDLRRGLVGYLATRLLARTVWRDHPFARHDGPASMRAAFKLDEAEELARRAGLDAEVSPQPGFRWAIRWRRAA